MLVRDGSPSVSPAAGTADFFKVIGVAPALGRAVRAGGLRAGRRPVAVISHGLCAAVFGAIATPSAATITLNDRPYTVIGVMPAAFSYEPDRPRDRRAPAAGRRA